MCERRRAREEEEEKLLRKLGPRSRPSSGVRRASSTNSSLISSPPTLFLAQDLASTTPKASSTRDDDRQGRFTMAANELDPYFAAVRSAFDSASDIVHRIPGSAVLLRYIKSSHQNDPFRSLLELLLVFFVIRTWRQSRTRGDSGGSHFIKFKPREIEELVAEWQPEPLLDPAQQTAKELSRPTVLLDAPGVRPKLVFGDAAVEFIRTGEEEKAREHSKEVLNLAGVNFAGLVGHERIKKRAIAQLKRSGVGSCGPPGFYGTFGQSPARYAAPEQG